jgi:hypothetical protein
MIARMPRATIETASPAAIACSQASTTLPTDSTSASEPASQTTTRAVESSTLTSRRCGWPGAKTASASACTKAKIARPITTAQITGSIRGGSRPVEFSAE